MIRNVTNFIGPNLNKSIRKAINVNKGCPKCGKNKPYIPGLGGILVTNNLLAMGDNDKFKEKYKCCTCGYTWRPTFCN